MRQPRTLNKLCFCNNNRGRRQATALQPMEDILHLGGASHLFRPSSSHRACISSSRVHPFMAFPLALITARSRAWKRSVFWPPFPSILAFRIPRPAFSLSHIRRHRYTYISILGATWLFALTDGFPPMPLWVPGCYHLPSISIRDRGFAVSKAYMYHRWILGFVFCCSLGIGNFSTPVRDGLQAFWVITMAGRDARGEK